MSWLKIDDGFEDHPKVEPISDAAHRLWTRSACWCQKTGSGGFVPRAMLLAIAKNSAPVKRLERLAQELVDARAGGVFEFGLWELAEGGWKFHDWTEYQPEHAKETMTRSEAASAAGKRSAEVRSERYGTAQPKRLERPPNEHRTFEQRSTNDVRADVRADVHRTKPERLEPPDPDPDPLPEEIPPSPLAGGSSNESDPWGLSGSIPAPAPPQRAPEPASGTHPAASGAPDPIPPSERQLGALEAKAKKPSRPRQVSVPPPDDFAPDQATLAAARATGRDWQADWAACRDWHLAKGPKAYKVDYQATLRGWMRRGFDSPRPAGVKAPRQVQPNEIDGPRPKEWTG